MVGETSYDKIDIDNLKIIGCSSKNPTNFDFTDGNHTYRFTSADSQLLMNFNNKNIVKDTWDVKYAENAYQIFADLADRVYGGTSAAETPLRESHSWKIDAERYSGFNAFYGISYKGGPNAFKKRIEIIADSYKDTVKPQTLNVIVTNLKEYADPSGAYEPVMDESDNLLTLKKQSVGGGTSMLYCCINNKNLV